MICLEFEPRYSETDQMGVIYHSHYITWFDLARTHYLKEIGIPYHQLEERGFLFPVHRVQVEYQRPARYGREVAVETRLSYYSGVRIRFTYEVYDLTDRDLLARGEVELAVTDRHFRVISLRKQAPDADQILLAARKKEEEFSR